jgi:hypothetical protein
MTRIELRRRIDEIAINGGRHWALYGREGVVSWGIQRPGREGGAPTHGAIKVHSPRPQWWEMEPLGGCPYLEGNCYTVAVYVAGHRLGKAWAAAGRDDDVIWSELATWYRTHLLRGAR